jgi:deoxyuridine 5'-triphosphate nucleotidohydrolase
MEMDSYSNGNCMPYTSEGFDLKLQSIYNELSLDEKITWLRGYFDTHGSVSKSVSGIKCFLKSQDELWTSEVTTLINVPYKASEYGLQYGGVNAIEFLHKLYHNSDCIEYNHNFASYRDLLYPWRPSSKLLSDTIGTNSRVQYPGDGMSFKFVRTLENGVPPSKAHITDTGYDLHLVKKVKEENGMVMYDTGIAVQPPFGFYFDLVGRSSISKTGYIVANSVGIIDASYTGSIKVALIKINKDAPELELPVKLVQLIPRQLVHLDALETIEIEGTKRAEGGFGSTSKQ